MKKLTLLTLTCLILSISLYAQNQDQIDIARVGSIPTTEGTGPHFTGNVRVNHTIPGGHPPNISGGIVIFDHGTRTVWHSHPKGQRVIIIQGTGWIQQWGRPKIEVCQGDVVWIPPNVKHWHGATETMEMSHYAFAEIHEGTNVENMEPVTDIQYYGR